MADTGQPATETVAPGEVIPKEVFMADAREIGAKFVEAFNAHDEARIRELHGENVVFEGPGDVKLEGREPAVLYAMSWLRAFPDARLTVTNEVAAGDWVVQECTFEGTHEDTLASPGGDIAATHKRVKGRSVSIFKVEGGVMTEIRLYFDQVQLMTQLGLMPQPATTTA